MRIPLMQSSKRVLAPLLVSVFAIFCLGLSSKPIYFRTKPVRIPTVSEVDWQLFRLKKIPCSVQVPGKPNHYSVFPGGVMAEYNAFFSFFKVPPPLGVIDDAISLLTLSIDLYTPEQFAALSSYLYTSEVYKYADKEKRKRLLWHEVEHPKVDVLDGDQYIYVRHDLRTKNGHIISCSAELRTPLLIPIAKHMLESVTLTESTPPPKKK